MSNGRRVVGIGEAAIDHLAVVGRYPEPDTKTELAGLSLQGGGATATALAALAALRVETAFVGKVSDDDFGRFVVRGLHGLGVDTRALVIQPDRLSPYRFVVVEHEATRRTVFHTRGSVDPLEPSELPPELFTDAALLIVDGYHVEAQIWAAEEARRRGVRVVLRAATLREGMGELVALSDVLIASERYAAEVAPRGEVEDSLVELSRLGPHTVVMTLGTDGSIGLEGEKLVQQPPLGVKVVDSTGAGDVYVGGYCYGLLRGAPLERCMQLASAAAGLSCRELGARAGLPSLAEVEEVT
ncbi:MAG: sugar kinase [Deltaproteobacteria bacterium]|nr:sugar kinase [Deltaproteobacteria bacterium]